MMGKEDDSEEQCLEEASGFSIVENSDKSCAAADEEPYEFLKCNPKADGLFYVEMLSTQEVEVDEAEADAEPDLEPEPEDGLYDEDQITENGHKALKRIIQNNIETPTEYCNAASAVVCQTNCEIANDLSDYGIFDDDGENCGSENQLLVFQDCDDSWRMHWYITQPESEDDFIALCWTGMHHNLKKKY